ncbi:endonuclease/exonuclease/phosphatase family protein [soil metagenome]
MSVTDSSSEDEHGHIWRTRRLRHATSLGHLVVGWLVVVAFGALAVVRAAGADRPLWAVWANTLGMGLYFPAWPVAILAAWFRRWPLALAAGALVVAHLVFVSPDVVAAWTDEAEAATPDQTTLRVFSMNLRAGNDRIDEVAEEIATADPDVLMTQELTPELLDALRSSGVLVRYDHAVVDAREGYFGSSIHSKEPLADKEVWRVAGTPMTRATVQPGGTPLSVYNVHTTAPLDATTLAQWDAEFVALDRHFEEAVDSFDGAVLAAGDFNANYQHAAFRTLVDEDRSSDHLREAYRQAGRGLVFTWPNRRRFGIPSISRLDHVLIDTDLTVLDLREGRGAGSDHRPVIADLALR